MIPEPPQATEAEQAVLGALMVSRAVLRAVIVQSGLRREHFYSEKHRAIFAACQRVAARGEEVDAITAFAQLERDEDVPAGITRSYLSELASMVPAPGNAPHYAGLVIEAAGLRAKREAALTILAGVAEHDDRRILEGIEAASADITESVDPSEPQEIGEALMDYLRDPAPPEVIELPWPTLNGYIGAGGFVRGEMVLMAGWTSIGKTLCLDQMLGHFAAQGKRCWLFCTEMSWLERACRWVAAETGIKYRKLIRREELDDEERRDVEKAASQIPFGFRDSAGWPAARICQEIAARRVDVAAIDPLNLIPFHDTHEYDEILRQLKEVAIRAKCVVIGVSQLNMARFREENPPTPALRDIRDSGNAQYIASHILSVHRTYRKGEPTKSGELRFLKVRNGVPGRCKVEFIPEAFRFVEPPPEPKAPTEMVLDYRGDDAD